MKKLFNKSERILFYTLIVIAASCFFFAGVKYQSIGEMQRAYDQTVITKQVIKDYQLEVYEDSTIIWDGQRKVITLPYDSTQTLDNIILMDNQ